MFPRDHIFHKQLVLVGGGHTHALIARMFGMKPLTGVKIVLISDVYHAPYSGMIPGYLAGLYSYDDAHIDLLRLCTFAGIEFVHGKVEAIDAKAKEIRLKDRAGNGALIRYDLLSIDIGSTPQLDYVSGASEYAVPVKPMPLFLEAFDAMISRLQEPSTPAQQIVMVGGGTAGVEVTLGLRRRAPTRHRIILVHRGVELLPEHPPSVRSFFRLELEKAGIEVRTNAPVRHVERQQLSLNGTLLPFDYLYWMTQASPAPWLRDSGLSLDDRGFIAVKPTLQTLNHDDVFAVGDVATILGHERPKAGVFAVRQAGPLSENLRAIVRGTPLTSYWPQKSFLVLIGTGDERAVAVKGSFAAYGKLGRPLWRLKDYIDRKFMRQFSELSDDFSKGGMETETKTGLERHDPKQIVLKRRQAMRCMGCASKVGGDVLFSVLAELLESHPRLPAGIKAGLSDGDDAAVFEVPSGQFLVQTLDYLTALVSDPYLLGRIAVLHAFSDVYAMGANAHSALALANVPFGGGSVQRSQLFQLLSGVLAALNEEGAAFCGGHSTETKELAIGISATGTVDPAKLLRKGGMRPGDVLVLTKPIGSGILFAANMRLKAKGYWIEAALKSMLLSNKAAGRIAGQHSASACTDVTGFGLAGHLTEMLQASLKQGSELTVTLDSDAIPVMNGARECLRGGIESSLVESNIAYAQFGSQKDQIRVSVQSPDILPLLFDPQTSGGLLFSVAEKQAATVLSVLKEAGYQNAAVIGSVELFHDARIILR